MSDLRSSLSSFRAGVLTLVVACTAGVPQVQAQQAAQDSTGAASAGGPVRLRQSQIGRAHV